ncbi:MAG: ArsR family transcriptional regulator, lead/cadmium/zinc/bismuth-responsive transcriptional [Fusobacteriaceae bacterium]|jgi:DNA-binding transcriptional ArsR family regulator|nr:ArsR family transcriptional regulator, lead/cadmium/zinc/bismuth-responsive transcriptional [Fusobacteriaceae bacterium]
MKKTDLICECQEIHKDIIENIKKNMYNEELLIDLANFYKIFSDPTRLKIIFALLNKELCVCDIAEVLGMTQSAISHQLRLLRNYKIVKSYKKGKSVFYSLDDEHIYELLQTGISHHIEKK